MTGSQKTQTQIKIWLGSFCSLLLALGCPVTPCAQAAESVILKVGSLQKSIKRDDLQQFADTGEISGDLRLYRPILTSEVRKMLQMRIHVDPKLAGQFLADLFKSPEGKLLLAQIKTALPETDPKDIQSALKQAVQGPGDLSPLGFLQAYPTEKLTLDLQATATIAAQLTSANLQSQILSPQLAQALEVDSQLMLPFAFNPAAAGGETVYRETRILEDKKRKRSLSVDIYYAAEPKSPLVVMSHGFAADRNFLKYLAHHLASHGLTVVSVEHPGSNMNSLVRESQEMKLSQILPAQEFIERPQDITFVLNELEKINQGETHLKNKFNTARVSIIGHSFGGYTALAVAGAHLNPKELRRFCQNLALLGRSPSDWLQCAAAKLPYSELEFRDARIAQVIAFNPIVGNLFAQSLAQVRIPTLILASSEDGITPNIAHQLQPFQQLGGEKYLLVAVGATHMSVTDLIYLNSSMGQSTLVREVMDETANPVRTVARGISLAFIGQLTARAKYYQPFLTSAYVQSLSSSNIALRLATQLPLSLEATLIVLALSHNRITSSTPESKTFLASRIKGSINRLFSRPEYHAGRLEQIFRGLFNGSPLLTKS